MGCSAAKGLAVEPIETSKVINISNGGADELGKVSSAKHLYDHPPLIGVEPEGDQVVDVGNVNKMQETSNGLAFEIDFEEESGESIIRKHPPKRFQRLEDQQITPSLSIDRLQEKLDEAEMRRQQFLQQRITSSKPPKVLHKQSSVYSIEEQDLDRLEVPVNKPDTPIVKQKEDTFTRIIQN